MTSPSGSTGIAASTGARRNTSMTPRTSSLPGSPRRNGSPPGSTPTTRTRCRRPPTRRRSPRTSPRTRTGRKSGPSSAARKTRASWGTSTSTTRSRPPGTSDRPSGAAAPGHGHAGLGGVDEERQRFLEVQLHRVGVVGQVADRQVLAQAQLEVAAAGGEQERAVDGGRPDDLPVDDSGHVLADRVAVIG